MFLKENQPYIKLAFTFKIIINNLNCFIIIDKNYLNTLAAFREPTAAVPAIAIAPPHGPNTNEA